MNLIFLLLMLFAGGENTTGTNASGKHMDEEKNRIEIPKGMQGIWKLKEDTSSHNYFVLEKDNDKLFLITYMNRHGDNRGLEHGGFTMSDVKGTKFIVTSNWDFEHPGWIYLKVTKLEPREWNMTAQLVTDKSISTMSPSEIRTFLEKNVDNPSIYGKELHFKKKLEFNSWK